MKKTLFLLMAGMLMSCNPYSRDINVIPTQPVLPVLTLRDYNPVLQLKIIKSPQTASYRLENISLDWEGTTDLSDIGQVRLYGADKKGRLAPDQPLSAAVAPQKVTEIGVDLTVEKDTLVVWASVQLKGNIDLLHRLGVKCTEVTTDQGRGRIADAHYTSLRTGVALRQHNQDGVHTSRIPGLTTTKKGTLLAIYDARYDSARDLQGDIDICLNRSEDGGRTWSPMQVVLDMGEWGGLPQKYNGVSDPNILVDENTGDIYVAGLWMHGVLDGKTGKWIKGLTEKSTAWMHQWIQKGSQPGFGVKESSQFLIAKSVDDGKTWSEPVNITRQGKSREWWLYAPAPGHGITLRDGTLVFPTQGRDKNGLPFSNITWSKDGGKTWHSSRAAYHDVTESMAVELSDGSIMLNMRDNRNYGNKETNGRRICTTRDLGETWTEHPTSHKVLTEPTCMAALHKHVYHRDGEEKSLLLFSNPDSYNRRDHITLKVSHDDGMTWPESREILLDEFGGAGYSCITSVDEETIGILYEGYGCNLIFQQIALSELL